MCADHKASTAPSQDPAVDLDYVLPAFTGRESPPRWIDAGHERLTVSEWKRVLRACRSARTIADAAFGPRAVARGAALELFRSPHQVRIAVAAILASLSAKNDLLVDLSSYWLELEAADRLGHEARQQPHVSRNSHYQKREPLPLEAARAIPILALLSRHGIDCRRVGKEYVARCPFHDDRQPSLRVSTAKGLWYCHPCGIGGDGIAFIQRLKGFNFATAVRTIAL